MSQASTASPSSPKAPRTHQWEIRGGAWEMFNDNHSDECILHGPAGTGKAQPLTSTVWTPSGPKKMGDVKIGDIICSPTCGTVTVKSVHPQGTKDVYRATFNTGESVECCNDHLWEVRWIGGSKKNGKKRREMSAVMPLSELRETYLTSCGPRGTRPKYWIPQGVAQFHPQAVPIDPYVLGVLIGDGSIKYDSVGFTSADPFIVSEVLRLLGDRYELHTGAKYYYRISANGWSPRKPSSAKPGYTVFSYGKYRALARKPGGGFVTVGRFRNKEDAEALVAANAGSCYSQSEIDGDRGIWGALEEVGLRGKGSGDKFVPEIYKQNSETIRMAMLQGLMDTDGTVDRVTGMPSYTTISKQLAEDVVFLVESLGGVCRITEKQPPNGQLAYTCWIRMNENKSIFRLPRKRDLAKDRTKYPVKRMIEKIEMVGQEECQCITVDSQDGLYFTDRFVVTHNSVSAISRLHYYCSTYPEIRCLMARKTRKSLTESGLVTFEKILGEQKKMFTRVQRQQRHSYVYPNGSEIIIGGMDDAAKVMSTDYDYVYIQEARDLSEEDWESLTTRLRNNKAPHQQIFGDTNPDTPTHWLRRRMLKGQTTAYPSFHQDNPALFDGTNWTPLGKQYISKLNKLTGVRRDRLLLGRWVQAEGVIYEDWDTRIHMKDWSSLPLTQEQMELGLMPYSWPRFIAVDFGYRGAFVCLWGAIDEDGRLYIYREIYRTGVLVEDHAREMRAIMASEPPPQAIICDHDAEGRATLERYLGQGTIAANKDVLIGIQAVQARLRVQGDGRPRVYIMRDCLVYRDPILKENNKPCSITEEIESYTWHEKEKKEEPVKENDHSLDAARYMICHLDLRGNLNFDVAFIG